MYHPKGFGYYAVGNMEPFKYGREEIGWVRAAFQTDPIGYIDQKQTKQEAGIASSQATTSIIQKKFCRQLNSRNGSGGEDK